MTDLELTTWIGCDDSGPFQLIFGGIDTTPDPDTMRFSKVNLGGKEIGRGVCSYVDATHFSVEDSGIAPLLVGEAGPSSVAWSIMSGVVTLSGSSSSLKARQLVGASA